MNTDYINKNSIIHSLNHVVESFTTNIRFVYTINDMNYDTMIHTYVIGKQDIMYIRVTADIHYTEHTC